MRLGAFSGWLLIAVMIAGPAALAQDESRQDIALQNQILELRQDVDALRAQVSAGGSSPAPAPQGEFSNGSGTPAASSDMLPQLLDRVSQLEDQVRTLQGQLDETRNKLQQQGADLGKQIADLGFRVQTLEGSKPADATPGSPVAGTSPPPPGRPLALVAPAAPSPAAPSPIAPAGLQGGYAALARRDYPAAEASARQTLANPRSPRAYDAQFLLAQALSGQRQYQQAALAYDDAYGKSRRGVHAADALLGLAASLASLGEKPAACATLDKLRGEFPAPRPDVRAAAAGIGKRANCR